MPDDRLSTTLAALADPTRRAILARLARGDASVTELAAPFPMSLPAVSRHLKVLERAGLIARGRMAQWRPCRLEAEPLRELAGWIEPYRRFWEERLDRLDDHLRNLQAQAADLYETAAEETHAMSETASAETLSLTLTRLYDAPRALVFRAWTEPEQLRRWCAPHGFTIPVSEGDLRPGGAWRATMRAPDGTEHRLVGRYTEIVAPERLAFTHAWLDADGRPGRETRVSVTLEDQGGKTLLRLTQGGFESPAARDGHAGGWGESLDRLAPHLAEFRR